MDLALKRLAVAAAGDQEVLSRWRQTLPRFLRQQTVFSFFSQQRPFRSRFLRALAEAGSASKLAAPSSTTTPRRELEMSRMSIIAFRDVYEALSSGTRPAPRENFRPPFGAQLHTATLIDPEVKLV